MNTVATGQLAQINDTFRQSGFGTMLTPGIQAIEDLSDLMQAVRSFNSFDEGNDPHGEHDFGTIVWKGTKVFWKIDYYDEALEYWEDPLSSTCHRVLTVMLAEEY